MRAYYAHPISWYGTDLEGFDVAAIEASGFWVINPADPAFALEVERLKAAGVDNVMPFFYELVSLSDMVFFRAFEDGKIGAGVFGEIEHAQENGIPVREITGDPVRPLFYRTRGLDLRRVLTIEETRARVRAGIV